MGRVEQAQAEKRRGGDQSVGSTLRRSATSRLSVAIGYYPEPLLHA